MLTELGYDGMNMNLLAKEAKYSKATVYVYFSGKDEIVRLLCIDRLELFRREISVILKNNSEPDEKLAAVRYALDEFASEDGVYFDFICASVYASPVSDASDSEKRLSNLIAGILADLSAIMPEAELKKAWYAYYGEYKTAKIFENGAK